MNILDSCPIPENDRLIGFSNSSNWEDTQTVTAGQLCPPTDEPVTSTTGRQLKLLHAAVQIADVAPAGDDMAFMHAILCQVGLPRSRVMTDKFTRVCGNAALSISAGSLWDGQQFVDQPLPYGAMPRLALAWINTYAVRHRATEIPIGDSASDFLRTLGKSPNGGKRSSFATFRQQMRSLSACRLTLGFNAAGKAYTYAGQPIKQFEAWMQVTGQQRSLWPGVVTLSQDYYATLSDHAVPIDMRAMMALKGSALAMDVYTMLANRLHRICGRPLVLHWANLRQQFGQEYQGKDPSRDFKHEFLKALKGVLTVYPQARVKKVTGGLLLMSSPPPIPYKY
ncbi:Putative replication protein A (fragment) [Cupriavidus necator]|uniref:Putative replication protein A n=1 Tax=Cupriavidus necator TaxID=106590 RepID=A0A1K0IMT7_CUPNE